MLKHIEQSVCFQSNHMMSSVSTFLYSCGKLALCSYGGFESLASAGDDPILGRRDQVFHDIQSPLLQCTLSLIRLLEFVAQLGSALWKRCTVALDSLLKRHLHSIDAPCRKVLHVPLRIPFRSVMDEQIHIILTL